MSISEKLHVCSQKKCKNPSFGEVAQNFKLVLLSLIFSTEPIHSSEITLTIQNNEIKRLLVHPVYNFFGNSWV
jgi:hypothetical protein